MTLFCMLVALPAISAIAVTVLTAFFALRAAARQDAPDEFLLRPCRGRRTVCRVICLATGLVSQFTMLLTYPLGPLVGRSMGLRNRADRPVVVCLHGLYHNGAAFLGLRLVLARCGFRRVLCLTYPSLGRDFEAIAVDLLTRVRREVSADTPLLFWGHSLGGLLVRRIMAEPDIAWRTRAAVTLGTPHRGSTLAGLAVGGLGRSLVPQSPLFSALEALPDPPGAALLSLASPMDNMVIPLSGLVVGRSAWIEEATAPVSHVSLLYHPGILKRSVLFLRDAPAVAGWRT